MNKLQVRVELLNDDNIVFDGDQWDEFEVKNGLLIIRKEESVIAAFNMKRAVSYFLVEEQDDID